MFTLWTVSSPVTGQENPVTGQENSRITSAKESTPRVVYFRALLDTGRKKKSLPAGVVVRVMADLFNPVPVDAEKRAAAKARGALKKLKETWEFTSGKVHRVTIQPPKVKGADVVYRRDQTLALDTSKICHDLLDGGIFSIEAAEGKGKPVAFHGTDFELGDRSIEVLVDGHSVLWIGESCVAAGYAETDAKAFAKLYEQLASQARRAFSK